MFLEVEALKLCTRKIENIGTPEITAVIILKCEQVGFSGAV